MKKSHNGDLSVVKSEDLENFIVDHYSTERKKPLIVFYDQKEYNSINAFQSISDKVFGYGLSKKFDIKFDEIDYYETKLDNLIALPQEVLIINYKRTIKNEYNGGYDTIILLGEKLAAASGKHIIICCQESNELWDDLNGGLEINNYLGDCCNAWKNRANFVVIDDNFAYREEAYAVYNGNGVLDTLDVLLYNWENNDCNIEPAENLLKEIVCNEIVEAKEEKLGNGNIRRHLRIILDGKTNELLKKQKHCVPLLEMYVDISGDGSIIDWEKSLFNSLTNKSTEADF